MLTSRWSMVYIRIMLQPWAREYLIRINSISGVLFCQFLSKSMRVPVHLLSGVRAHYKKPLFHVRKRDSRGVGKKWLVGCEVAGGKRDGGGEWLTHAERETTERGAGNKRSSAVRFIQNLTSSTHTADTERKKKFRSHESARGSGKQDRDWLDWGKLHCLSRHGR